MVAEARASRTAPARDVVPPVTASRVVLALLVALRSILVYGEAPAAEIQLPWRELAPVRRRRARTTRAAVTAGAATAPPQAMAGRPA